MSWHTPFYFQMSGALSLYPGGWLSYPDLRRHHFLFVSVVPNFLLHMFYIFWFSIMASHTSILQATFGLFFCFVLLFDSDWIMSNDLHLNFLTFSYAWLSCLLMFLVGFCLFIFTLFCVSLITEVFRPRIPVLVLLVLSTRAGLLISDL